MPCVDKSEYYWWVLDDPNNSNKIKEAREATGLDLVGLVSPEGCVVAYVVDSVAEAMCDHLNKEEVEPSNAPAEDRIGMVPPKV